MIGVAVAFLAGCVFTVGLYILGLYLMARDVWFPRR